MRSEFPYAAVPRESAMQLLKIALLSRNYTELPRDSRYIYDKILPWPKPKAATIPLPRGKSSVYSFKVSSIPRLAPRSNPILTTRF